MLALLEHRHNHARSTRAYSSAIVAKMPEYARGPLFECAPAAKTLSRAQVTLFEHAQDARTRSVTPIRAGPSPESHA